jgi:hypothetical protein
METWHKFWRLNAQSRVAVFEAVAALAATWVGIRVVGFPLWKSTLLWLTSGARGRWSTAKTSLTSPVRSLMRIEGAAARHLFFRPNCLEQSLTLWWLLQRRRIAAELRFGARKQEGRFEAHAWVEVDGVRVSETEGAHIHFAPFNGSIIPDRAEPLMETQPR